MRAGKRAQQGDKDIESGTGGEAVGQQSDGAITARQLLAHDAGADHQHEQEGAAQGFRREAPGQGRHQHSVLMPQGAPPQQLSVRKPSNSFMALKSAR